MLTNMLADAYVNTLIIYEFNFWNFTVLVGWLTWSSNAPSGGCLKLGQVSIGNL